MSPPAHPDVSLPSEAVAQSSRVPGDEAPAFPTARLRLLLASGAEPLLDLGDNLVGQVVGLAGRPLDPAALKARRVKAEEVLQAIQKEYPEFKARLADESTFEVFVSETQRVVLTERLRLPGNGGVRLKDVLLKERANGGAAEK